jgi:hypothetical protein
LHAFEIADFIQSPLIALQAAMPLKDMATTTGVFEFLRYADLVLKLVLVASVADFVI